MAVRVRGAREHNLRDVDLEVPTGSIVVCCGVSGSGKSSLAFDTLHAEGQRRYLQALGLSARLQLQPPEVDRVEGLPPTLALAQHAKAPGPRDTVGGVSGVSESLRLLFGCSGVLHCPICDRAIEPRSAEAITAAVFQGPPDARVWVEAPVRGGLEVLGELERAGFSRVRLDGEVHRIEDLRGTSGAGSVQVVVDRIKLRSDRRDRLMESIRLAGRVGHGQVLVRVDAAEHWFVDRPFCAHDGLELPALEPRLLSARSRVGACPACDGAGCAECDGAGLSAPARAVRWRGQPVAHWRQMGFSALAAELRGLERTEVEAPIVEELLRLSLIHI